MAWTRKAVALLAALTLLFTAAASAAWAYEERDVVIPDGGDGCVRA